jgi:cell division protein FtsB
MVDSVNLAMREISMQNTVAQVNEENKLLKKQKQEQAQLIKDLADGIKCKNIFGKIVNCKKSI